jgi:predicted nucleic-acid-binding protein
VRAVDTNILARYYLQDDRRQSRVAGAVLAAGNVFVSRTVILELEWVLRSVAEQPRAKVLACLAHLAGLPGVTVEDREQVEVAIQHCASGMDFADALHWVASRHCEELLTFDDRGFARRAAKVGLLPPVRVPAG